MNARQPLILIADDDPAARLLQSIALQGGGFTVEAVADGTEALTAFDRLQPDCLVLDVVMPGLTGFDVCRQIRARQNGQHTPILILTSLDDLDSISTAYVAGATDFAQKGINPLLLVERVRFMLRAKNLQDGLIASESRLAQAQRMARIGHWECDPEGNTLSVSPVVLEILSFPQQTKPEIAQLYSRVHPDDLELFIGKCNAIRTGSARISFDFRVVAEDGVERFIHLQSQAPDSTTDLSCQNRVVTMQDITELRRAEEHIRLLAFFDSLTGLPNRAFLHEQLSLRLKVAAGTSTQIAVIALDLEQFNRVNHSLGSQAGDDLLRAVAQRLKDHFLVSDQQSGVSTALNVGHSPVTVARIGGDEFGIVVAINPNSTHLAAILQQLADRTNLPFQIGGQEIAIGATFGASVFPEDADDAETLLRSAEAALHQAKKNFRGGYQFYNTKMQEHASRRLSLESDLRRALQREQFELYFQPRVLADSLQPIAVEALLRWQHPDRGAISPVEFIPIAEDSGLILELGEWALDKACEYAASWASGQRPLRTAVNVSAIQLQRAAVAEQIAQALRRHRLDPTLLEIEITEGILIDNPALAKRTLESLKSQSIRIALDDFGTGYSSLSYLRTLPIDYLKIDRSFVADLQTGNDSAAIITTILTLARGLGLHTIAEGVESDTQRRFLAHGGCDELQGFLFAPAMAAPDLTAWLAKARRLHVSGHSNANKR